MTDLSDIDPIVADVILEEEEASNMPSDSEMEGASISASQVGPSDTMPRNPSAASSAQRPSSALTVENLRLHEQSVANEEKSLSRHGSANSSHRERPVSRGSLGPVRTPGSGTPVRLCSGKSGLGNITDVTTTTTDVVLRSGSGKRDPLPPIGVDSGPLHKSALDVSRLSISREAGEDGETMVSSARLSAHSERSVTFKEQINRSQTSLVDQNKRAVKSPAVREVHRTTGEDGKERIAISCSTETEWSWLEMMTFLGKSEEELAALSANMHPKTPSEQRVKSALSHGSRLSQTEDGQLLEAREGSKLVDGEKETTTIQDHDDVPPLELDSDSELSEDEEGRKPLSDQGVPKIGPPRIIKYQRESEQIPISQKYRDAADIVGRKLDIDLDDLDSADFSDDEDPELEARIKGRRKPTYDDEDDYQDPQEESGTKASRKKAIFRSESNEGEVTPPLSTVEEQKEVCEYCGKEAKSFPTLVMQKTMDASELYCCKDYQELVEYTMENTPLSQHPSEEMIDIAPHAPYGSKQARRAAKERAAQRMRDREMARQRAAGTNQANFYALQVARQMKTINYSLASQKCLDEGWTVRPPTPEDDDRNKKLIYVPEPTTPQLPAIFKSRKNRTKETPVVQKKYTSGQVFLVMFEDGTGAVFYPSGSLAILISAVDKNQFSYYIYSDTKIQEANLLAVFEPNGNGTCYHGNGNIRLNMNQFGGLFTDQTGTIKKRWSWKDEDTLSKTPPFQPLCFSLNQQISVRCMTQDQIFINFNCDLQTCRFNAGAKLKLVAPDHIPPKEIDRDTLYISEVKTYVQMVLDLIFNQKNFSKSPKLDNLRPSLKIQSSVRKNERLKQKVIERKVAKKTGPVVTVK